MKQESLQTNGQEASSKRETRSCSDMIFEYAIEPALLDNWKDIRYFKDECGAEKGRLISEYPYKWVRAVFETIRLSSNGDVEKHRMKEALRNIAKYKLFRRQGILWDVRLSWLDNARIEHTRINFRAIIPKNCGGDDEQNCILAGEHIDESNNLWKCPQSVTIERDGLKMAMKVAPVLQLSTHIIFIDPHFDPGKGRFRNPLIEFLRVLATRTNGVPLQRLEYHVSNEIEEGDFKHLIDTYLKPVLPHGLTLAFCRWKNSEMHNRFILSNIGLIEFGIGLDEYVKGGPSPQEDQLNRLSDTDHSKFWVKYSTGVVFHTVSA
jgi:hypothetical protein